MALSISLTANRPEEIYWGSLFAACMPIAEESGLHACLWLAAERGIKTAADATPILKSCLATLICEPEKYEHFREYQDFLKFVKTLLGSCLQNPDAIFTTRDN